MNYRQIICSQLHKQTVIWEYKKCWNLVREELVWELVEQRKQKTSQGFLMSEPSHWVETWVWGMFSLCHGWWWVKLIHNCGLKGTWDRMKCSCRMLLIRFWLCSQVSVIHPDALLQLGAFVLVTHFLLVLYGSSLPKKQFNPKSYPFFIG